MKRVVRRPSDALPAVNNNVLARVQDFYDFTQEL